MLDRKGLTVKVGSRVRIVKTGHSANGKVGRVTELLEGGRKKEARIRLDEKWQGLEWNTFAAPTSIEVITD